MLSIKKLLLLAVTAAAAAAATIKCDISQVNKDLQTIHAGLVNMTTAVNSYQRGFGSALNIMTVQQKLAEELRTGTTNVNTSCIVSERDAKKVLASVKTTLLPSITDCLAALESKRGLFRKDYLTNAVMSVLSSFQADSIKFAAALLVATPLNQVPQARDLMGEIDGAFNKTITFYLSKTPALL